MSAKLAPIERFAALAGLPSPAWPGGKPVRQSKARKALVYGTTHAAARIRAVTNAAGKVVGREYNWRTLDIARPAQTRGSSRIPEPQDIAHAIGAVSAGSPDRDPNPLGARALWDWVTGTPSHWPWVPEAAQLVVMAEVVHDRRLRLAARDRVSLVRAIPGACRNAYRLLVWGSAEKVPRQFGWDNPLPGTTAKALLIAASQADALLVNLASYAAEDALEILCADTADLGGSRRSRTAVSRAEQKQPQRNRQCLSICRSSDRLQAAPRLTRPQPPIVKPA